MNEDKIMSAEAFNELIDGFEIIGNLTEYGRKNIKYHVKKLQQENQQLKEQLEQKESEIKELCKKIKVNEKSRRKMQKSLMETVQKSEKARKEAIELLEKHLEAKSYDNHKYELFSREYLEELLKILYVDKGELIWKKMWLI